MTEACPVNFFFLCMNKIGSSSQYVLFKFIYLLFTVFFVGFFVCFFVCIPSLPFPSSYPPVFLSLRQGFSVKYYPETCFVDPGLELRDLPTFASPALGLNTCTNTLSTVLLLVCGRDYGWYWSHVSARPCEADAESPSWSLLTLFIGKRALTGPRTRQFKLV